MSFICFVFSCPSVPVLCTVVANMFNIIKIKFKSKDPSSSAGLAVKREVRYNVGLRSELATCALCHSLGKQTDMASLAIVGGTSRAP